jgi:hypothetical protein
MAEHEHQWRAEHGRPEPDASERNRVQRLRRRSHHEHVANAAVEDQLR